MPLVRASTHASHVYEEKYAEAFSPMRLQVLGPAAQAPE